MGNLEGKSVLLSGGTSGIGKAAALALKAMGANVTVLARTPEKATASGLAAIACDLASQNSVRDAAAAYLAKHSKLDVLILSAGVFLKERSDTADGVERTFAINYLSHFLLANLLEEALVRAAPSRVILVASKYGNANIDFDDLMLKKRRFSILSSVPPTKLAEVLLAQELAERWATQGVSAYAVHPGLVARTQLLDEVGGIWKFMTNLFGGTPEKGADTVVWLASAPEAAGLSGKLLANRKPIPAPGQGSDPAARKRLWEESARLTRAAGATHPLRPAPVMAQREGE